MKKLIFLSILFFASCTRYVYVVMPTQIKEIQVQKPYQMPFRGDDMPFGGVQIPNDFTLPYRPLPHGVIGAELYKDSVKYFRAVDSLFFAPPKNEIRLYYGGSVATDSIITVNTKILRQSMAAPIK